MFQVHERLELEIERMKQIHQKELEDKDEELEDVQKSCQKRVGPCWVGGGAGCSPKLPMSSGALPGVHVPREVPGCCFPTITPM